MEKISQNQLDLSKDPEVEQTDPIRFPSSVSGDSLGALLGITAFLSSNFVVYGPEFFNSIIQSFMRKAYDFNGDGI